MRNRATSLKPSADVCPSVTFERYQTSSRYVSPVILLFLPPGDIKYIWIGKIRFFGIYLAMSWKRCKIDREVVYAVYCSLSYCAILVILSNLERSLYAH